MIDKRILQRHFSRNAASYDTYARVQKKMAAELLNISAFDFADDQADLAILEIGCGTGHLTRQLLSSFPNAAITAVDIAPGMIEFARERVKNGQVEFSCLDIEEAVLEKKYDIIISNTTFQWFNNLEGTIEKLGQMLKNNGAIAFSTFGHLTFNELHHSYEIARNKLGIAGEQLPSQNFFQLEEILKICRDRLEGACSGRYDFRKNESLEQEYFNSVREFLDSVKKIGANNSNLNRRSNIALTKEMMKVYEEIFKEGGLIKATYHCIFVVAKK